MLEKYTDEELFQILGSDVEEEIKNRGYEFGWHKRICYAGVIYILVNPAFPNLVKIGYADDVEKRVKTLNRNSALPDPYHVYATYKVKKRLEDMKLHKLIDSLDSDLRHSKNREFYEMSPEKAYAVLSAIAEINGDEDLLERNPLHDGFFNENKGSCSISKEEDRQKQSRSKAKPRLTFAMLNIPIGTELVYKDDESIVVKTADNQSGVEYNGKVYKMSALIRYLKNGGS